MSNKATHQNTRKRVVDEPRRGPTLKRPIKIEKVKFLDSLHSSAVQALLAEAQALRDSSQFPPTDSGELER